MTSAEQLPPQVRERVADIEKVISVGGPVRVLYRLVTADRTGPQHFVSNLSRCRIPRGPERDSPIIWAGISMYDSTQQAETTARRYKGRVGTYLAEVHIPEEAPQVVVLPTLTVGHFTVLCCIPGLMLMVHDVRPIVGLAG